MTSKITENLCWRHYFSPLMTFIYNHQNLFKYVWTGLKNLDAKNQPNMDSVCFLRLLRMIWQIPRRHHSTTQYQVHSLSSLCYLKIYFKPLTYKQKNVVERRTWNHLSHHWIKPIHVMDMIFTLISSTMMSIMHFKKNRWCCLRVFASFDFGNSLKTSFVFWRKSTRPCMEIMKMFQKGFWKICIQNHTHVMSHLQLCGMSLRQMKTRVSIDHQWIELHLISQCASLCMEQYAWIQAISCKMHAEWFFYPSNFKCHILDRTSWLDRTTWLEKTICLIYGVWIT